MSEDTPVEDVVKNPDEVKPTEETPPSVDKPENNESDLKSVIDGLTERVSSVETIVESLTTDGTTDSVPGGKQPWTHKRWFG